MVTDVEGRLAVERARGAIETHLSGRGASAPAPSAGPPLPPLFRERRGVFVTLSLARSGDLRGCIGFPLPHLPLEEGLRAAAVAAATEDPRFPPVSAEEMRRLLVEVSLLTVPSLLRVEPREDLPASIEVGRDGLIVEGWGTSGLLLPQVAVEWGWDARTFLDETCGKAGLPSDAWLDPRTRVRAFRADVFHETSPGGPVERAGATIPSPRVARGARRT